MKLKRILLANLLLTVFALNACVGQKEDDIGLGGNSSQSYAERYQPARHALNTGNFAVLQTLMGINPTHPDGTKLTDDETKEKIVAMSSELSLLERGLLTLNTGDYARALLYFDAAEIKMEATDAAAKNTAGQSTFAAVTGMEESKDYLLRGYEKVMLYNYKALCYMLLGDRKAYNVTRKAIDKQQEEWELFKTRLADLKKESKDSDTNTAINKEDTRNKYTKEKAMLVPNAYVNPFGDYMDAMILEIDSYNDKTLRDNARIAYKKVLDNNADCTAAKQAMADMRKNAPKNKKLVHVLLADGFSPERVEKTIDVYVAGVLATANYAEATPHPSMVASASVKAGKTTYEMSSLSKLESIILRDDLDNKPFRTFMIALAFARTAALQVAGDQAGVGGLGFLASRVAANVQRPDTRTWLSLPNQILAARFYVPNDTETLTISTYDKMNRNISTTEVELAEKGPSVIYAVNYNIHLEAVANDSTWLTK